MYILVETIIKKPEIIMNKHLKLLMALLAFTFTVSESLEAQSAKEVGQELTEQYFPALGLTVPNPMVLEGNDAWMTPLPSNFNLDSYKSEINQVSERLGVEVIGEWVQQDEVVIYGVNYKGHTYGLAHMPSNNIMFAQIQEGTTAPAKSGTSNNNNSSTGTWTTVQTFSGSGMKSTQPFTVNSDEWRVIYSSEASNSGMGGAGHIFQLFLLEPGQEDFEGDIVANDVNKRSISGDSYIYKSGRFYFKSNSANGDWEIEVQVRH